MAAKIFEVGDVLPATTQLRISWTETLTLNDIYSDTGYQINTQDEECWSEASYNDFIGVGGGPTRPFVIANYWIAENDFGDKSWVGSYASKHYIDIDLSSNTLAERTITFVNIGYNNKYFYWEDLATPVGYSITYEENGGTTIPDVEDATELPTPLPTPTKSGYTFLGWYYDSVFTNKATAGDSLTANVTLYAKWELTTYTITYNTNGGSSVSQTSNATQLPDPLPITTKPGYTFVAWYYESNFQTRAKTGDTIESNVTLYAKWHNLGSLFTEIADAIRSKDGTSESIRDVDFGERVNALPSPKEEETKTVTPNFASGNVDVTPTSGKVMTQVTINKDSNLIADNIKKDITVHGITGTLESGGGGLEGGNVYAYKGGMASATATIGGITVPTSQAKVVVTPISTFGTGAKTISISLAGGFDSYLISIVVVGSDGALNYVKTTTSTSLSLSASITSTDYIFLYMIGTF